jgi:4a-hydroxytetrahydrobiopterin dehydratase
MPDRITGAELQRNLKKIPEWELTGDTSIFRELEFDEFMDAIEMVNDVAEIAEELDHHPDIDIRFNKLTIRLSTHSKGGLTKADFELAARIDTIAD